MFRRTIHLDERADVQQEAERLRAHAVGSGLAPAVADQLAASFGDVLGSLVHAGRTLKGQGSQLDVSRKIGGPGYAVTLRFGAAQRTSFFDRLKQALRGR